VKSGIAGQTVHLTERKSVWQFYEIRFAKILRKREVIRTELIFELSDPAHSFVPFISASIEEPTEKLSFTLEVPPGWQIPQVFCETSSCIGARVPFDTEVKTFTESVHIDWDPKPRIHFHYEMRWDVPRLPPSG
jgi:hypothetical protein